MHEPFGPCTSICRRESGAMRGPGRAAACCGRRRFEGRILHGMLSVRSSYPQLRRPARPRWVFARTQRLPRILASPCNWRGMRPRGPARASSASARGRGSWRGAAAGWPVRAGPGERHAEWGLARLRPAEQAALRRPCWIAIAPRTCWSAFWTGSPNRGRRPASSFRVSSRMARFTGRCWLRRERSRRLPAPRTVRARDAGARLRPGRIMDARRGKEGAQGFAAPPAPARRTGRAGIFHCRSPDQRGARRAGAVSDARILGLEGQAARCSPIPRCRPLRAARRGCCRLRAPRRPPDAGRPSGSPSAGVAIDSRRWRLFLEDRLRRAISRAQAPGIYLRLV